MVDGSWLLLAQEAGDGGLGFAGGIFIVAALLLLGLVVFALVIVGML